MTLKNLKEAEKRNKILDEIEWNFVNDFVQTRKNHNLSQQKIADKSNVIRETIARIETHIMSPTIGTMIDILEPLGYTIKIVPMDKNK